MFDDLGLKKRSFWLISSIAAADIPLFVVVMEQQVNIFFFSILHQDLRKKQLCAKFVLCDLLDKIILP
jgi:hypothetical protein